MSVRRRFWPGRSVASGPPPASNLFLMREPRRRQRPIRGAHAPVSAGLVSLALCSALCVGLVTGCSGGDSNPGTGPTAPPSAAPSSAAPSSDESSTAAAEVTQGSVPATTLLPTVALPTGPVIGCLTNGSITGAFEVRLVDSITQVNTKNVGENAPDAYYATSAGKNTVGYFVFGNKSTVVVNGDGSWTGESGADSGSMEIAADGSGAIVKATIEGSDVNGQRAKPLTLDLVTKCGVELPTTVPPTPADTKQKFTETVVEDTSTTPS